MSIAINPWHRRLGQILVGLPLLSLALAAVAWLRYGIDMPWFDDWRGYSTGTIDSLDLHYLFQPMNDTMSPVGLALDALAQRYLDGNSIAYQFLSMVTVLGSLLLLQWKLLNRALGGGWQVAVCFLFTALMLQPDSYWGLENLAYYQALPLVFILWALWLMSGPGSAWRGPGVALLGLLAGFTYISGAFGGLALGVASLALVWRLDKGADRRHQMRDWFWFTGASALTVAAQFYFSVLKFRGTHAGIPLALPTEASFWFYYLGKLGRSLLLPQNQPGESLPITVLACVIALASAMLLYRRALSARPTDPAREKQVASIFLPLGALVVVYLMLVAAGRTNFRPVDMHEPLKIFAHGFTRFHFFWATLIWPWVVAALFALRPRTTSPARAAWPLAVAFVLAALMVQGGGLGHMSEMQQIGAVRTRLAHCLLKELQEGGEVRCQGLLPPHFGSDPAPDAFPAYLYAKKIGASFVRNFPTLVTGKRREKMAPFYRFDAASAKPRMSGLEALGNGLFRSVGTDPQLYIQTRQPQITRRCATMDIDIEIKVSAPDTLQLFYAPAGDDERYSEQNVATQSVGTDGDSLQTLSFRLDSETGFFESLRLDPVTRPQVLSIPSIRVYCVRELP